MKKLIILLCIFNFSVFSVFSADIGGFLDQKIEGDNNLFTYAPSFTPWFSWNGSNGSSFYLSALLSLKLSVHSDEAAHDSSFEFIPELMRFAYKYQNTNGISIEAGRIAYNDVLGFITSGLFDGFRFKMSTVIGVVSAGAYYSGFLYKETAKIIMTNSDITNYALPWDFNSFGAYFASRRLLVSLRLDIPLLRASNLSVEALGQFDLNSNDDKIHSQYCALNFDYIPTKRIKFTAGAVFEMIQNEDGVFSGAFAALAHLKLNLPTAFNDQLGVKILYTSGSINDVWKAFSPVNSIPQGMIFTGTASGLMAAVLDYQIRIIKPLYADIAFNYYVNTSQWDTYGGELWVSANWQPFGDFCTALGVGAFFPGMGNRYEDSDVQWKIKANITFSF